MGLAQDLLGIAGPLIEEYGEPATYLEYGEPEIGAGGGTVERSETNHSVFVFTDNFDRGAADGKLIELEDSIMYVVTTDFVPKQGDIITLSDDGVEYKVQAARKYRAQAVNILYELQVRG